MYSLYSDNSYDLDNGPVTYQTYNPYNNGGQAEKKFYDLGALIEESYQTPYDGDSERIIQDSARTDDTYYRESVRNAINILADIIYDNKHDHHVARNHRNSNPINSYHRRKNTINILNNKESPRVIHQPTGESSFVPRKIDESNLGPSDNSMIKENIYQPRPQVIHYIFKPKNPQVDTNIHQKPQITSLEISEKPHHRIRHHHGEKQQ